MSKKAFDPRDHLDEIKRLASLGMSEAQIATKLNIDKASMRAFRRTFPEVEQAIQQGLNESIEQATASLMAMVKSADFRAIKYFLDKKGGWGDQSIEISSSKPSIASFELKLVTKKEDVEGEDA